jgi:phage tail sheath protein FI
MHMTQAALGVLMPLWEFGGLRGNSPMEAFYVRCDASVNPPETVALGQVFMEVGVAIAAPGEFIVFRLGRKEGVTEVLE